MAKLSKTLMEPLQITKIWSLIMGLSITLISKILILFMDAGMVDMHQYLTHIVRYLIVKAQPYQNFKLLVRLVIAQLKN